MGILDEDVARVRDATDLVALAGEHLALKRVGKRFVGAVPVPRREDAVVLVNPEIGRYYCFGCQASGDAITFVREVEHLDFVDAVERLAARAGITLRYDDKSRQPRTVGARRGSSKRSAPRSTSTSSCCSRRPKAAPRASTSAVAASTATRCAGSGSAGRPTTGTTLSVHLQQQKFSRDDLVDAGLAFVNQVEQAAGPVPRPAACSRSSTARATRSASAAARSATTARSTRTRRRPRSTRRAGCSTGSTGRRRRSWRAGEVVICEGYTDVMAFALAGAPNAVATCGTALADDHFQILKNLARQGGARVRRRRRGAGRGRALVRVGAALRDPGARWPTSRRARSRRRVARRPGSCSLQAVERGQAVPRSSASTARSRRPTSPPSKAGPGPPSGAAAIVGRAPERPRARPVRDAAGRRGSTSTPTACARRSRVRSGAVAERRSVAGAAPSEPDRGAAARRRAATARRPARARPAAAGRSTSRAMVDGLARRAPVRRPDRARGVRGRRRRRRRSTTRSRRPRDRCATLLERLAVEEPVEDDEPETLRARLMANAVEPAAERVLHVECYAPATTVRAR